MTDAASDQEYPRLEPDDEPAADMGAGHAEAEPAAEAAGTHAQGDAAADAAGARAQAEPVADATGAHAEAEPVADTAGAHAEAELAADTAGAHAEAEPAADTAGAHAEAEPAADATGGAAGAEQASDTGGYAWPAGKVDPQKRIVAIVIDAVIAVAIGLIPWIGGLVSAAYWVLRDGLDLEFMDRRSLGKKVTKLRPVNAQGEPLDMMGSVRRNWMFGVGGVIQVLVYIPILGWLLMIPVVILAFVIGIVELYRVITDPEGRRVGDLLAETKVIEVAD